MQDTVFITDAVTGETRSYLEQRNAAWDEGPSFCWSEGNFSCDCNRADFFRRAGGDDDDQDAECGEGRYMVKIVSADGAVLYDETTTQPQGKGG